MTDLEKRRLHVGRPPLMGYRNGEEREAGTYLSIPEYESDPAAACSLLPKIARAMFSRKTSLGYWQNEWYGLLQRIGNNLEFSYVDPTRADEVPRLIFEAVQKLQGVKT